MVFWDDVVNDGVVFVTAGSTLSVFGLVSGDGSFGGDGTKHFAGGVDPGHSPGRIEMDGPVVLEGASVVMELAGLEAGVTHDEIVFSAGTVRLGGGIELDVVLLDAHVPALGDRYDLFDWNGSFSALSGRFSQLTLPTLADGLLWDTSRLYIDGEIAVAAVPEAQTWATMALGLLAVGFRLRRRR
jgi:hypothetical protein